jgi:hypothetical protein
VEARNIISEQQQQRKLSPKEFSFPKIVKITQHTAAPAAARQQKFFSLFSLSDADANAKQ